MIFPRMALILLLILPSMCLAQPVSLSCPETLRTVEIDRSILELHIRQLRQTMSTELRQALERAEKAEQAMAKAHADAQPKQADAVKQEK